MSDGPDTSAPAGAHGTRLALFIACFVPMIVLLGMLLVASPSDGAITDGLAANAFVEPEEAAEEEGEGWEEEDGEWEEWEEDELEEDERFPPEECLLRTASAHAVAYPKRKKLKLTIGYTTYAPTNATIEVERGAVQVASLSRRLGRSGVVRIIRKLSEKQSGGQIVVRLQIPGSPGYCRDSQTERLAVKHASPTRVTWAARR